MSEKRFILGIWLIERGSGRNLVARSYDRVEIDMDLIGPFLSATHTFIDKASNEELRTIDTEASRYVWEATEQLLFVMAVSKNTRVALARFLLQYALSEFLNNHIPQGEDVASVLRGWQGSPETFQSFGEFLDELVSQYEVTDESLILGKSMDCLEVYNHLFRAIMQVKTDSKTRNKLVKSIVNAMAPLTKSYPFLAQAPVDKAGIEVVNINILSGQVTYKSLRNALGELLEAVALTAKATVDNETFRNMIFDSVMPYVKRDLQRITTYAILGDVIRDLF